MQDIKLCHLKKHDQNTVWRRVDDEIFIIVPQENDARLFKLNKTAGYLWENCDGAKTVGELIKELCSKYDVDEKSATQDAFGFIEKLKGLQMIHIVEPDSN